MITLQVLEHQRLRIGESSATGEQVLSEQEAFILESLIPRLPRGVCRWDRQGVRFSQYCGVICLGTTVVEILPKISGKEQEPGVCRDVLVGMLSECKEIEPVSSGSAPLQLQQSVLLDAFVLGFCRDLDVQLAQGLLRRYVSRQENISVLRGKLRVDLQFKHNLAHQERVYCEYDELSADIPINQIIKGVLRRLERLPLGQKALKRVRDLALRFDEVADVNAIGRLFEEIAPDRTVARYSSVLRQCGWFLNGMYPDITAGGNDAAALLFDMNRLFEACVTRAMRREAFRRNLQLRAQGPRRWFARDSSTGRDVVAMKPDLTITDADGGIVLVADAKWKVLDEGDADLGVAESDLYQIAAYAGRYGSARAALIYPQQLRFTTGRMMTLYAPQVSVQLIPFDVAARSLREAWI